ncbi:conserved hypothetical protein [Shewanella sediminis HAW-EB3]|uniref:Probable 4-amino-4-deoxy-L-arabinose-phosphoundecaprenol flippase subunit ArnF n=1 Tax=Shewanella sediminis (strain HAW-EB3) TaxID=425104 RepID=ARNF_SHESH|nr:4-amino-4-deoxy-L-arabinose-phosphoundecaprenol flippase subunit ArnF [Shewanella sediminis]A8FRQ8.1 RecName: Full=Probable 4-amino-4-deoxy-L-arabinose-phosphoundecaprenol flippase subunit ArnF; Short=L-Ara4N-phosphoundecaprenol flippase subunit ArnF; AltName: Full=Undecaprenyl phosphate-aminoarabinose flippase subunit ArnF [Shewanella sediminis HAW-EB3]ABV35531.1 conserved hypothetical protein [Shewanella sediminis HAW-EB3]
MAHLTLSIRGLLLALMSVLLISVAQLSMKWGMGTLNQLWSDLVMLWQGEDYSSLFSQALAPVMAVGAGLFCYALSMACWVMALKRLPLSIAYPLLSLSYVLVYLGAVYLPWLNEPLSWVKGTGIFLILLGLIFVLPKKNQTSDKS